MLDALCSFPSLRTLNQSTFEFVRPWTVNDGFLKSLASRGIFEVGDVRRTPFHVANGIPGGKITEDGIIDYCFGVYDDGGKGRRLHVADPQLSPQFIDKLVEVRRNSCVYSSVPLLTSLPFSVHAFHSGATRTDLTVRSRSGTLTGSEFPYSPSFSWHFLRNQPRSMAF